MRTVASESRPGSKGAGCNAHDGLRRPIVDSALCAILRPSPGDERGASTDLSIDCEDGVVDAMLCAVLFGRSVTSKWPLAGSTFLRSVARSLRGLDKAPFRDCGSSPRSASAAVAQMGAALGWLQRNAGPLG